MLFFIFIIILLLFNYYVNWVRKFFLSSTPYPSDCSGVLLRDLVTLATWPGRLNKCQSKMSYEVLAFILAILVSISLIFFAIWNVSMRKPLQCNFYSCLTFFSVVLARSLPLMTSKRTTKTLWTSVTI